MPPYHKRKVLHALLPVYLQAHYTLTQAINMLCHLGIKNLPPRMLTQLAWEERPEE